MERKFYLSIIILTALLCTAWFVYGREQKTRPNAQAWEYKRIALSRGASTTVDWTSWWESSPNGEITLSLPVNAAKRLNELGAEGWELVSVVPISNHFSADGDYAGYTGQINYFLKRLK